MNDGDTRVKKVARGAWRVPPTRACVCLCVCVSRTTTTTGHTDAKKRGNDTKRALEKGDRPSVALVLAFGGR